MDLVNRRSNILTGEPRASVYNRFLARAIDLLVVGAVYFFVSALWKPLGILAAMVFCALQDALGAGQSVGKRIVGLRVIEDGAGAPCSAQDSFLRNFPFVLAVLFATLPVLWVFLLLLCVPAVAFEVYLLLTLDSGVRLGDVLGNTVVVEHIDA